MRPHDPPPPVYAFGYRSQPRSGNEINGWGRGEKVRATPVFHSAQGAPVAWQALDEFFSSINPWSEPGRGFSLSEELLRRRGERQRPS
ncbi:MAG TPA: hypothetical protein QGG47_10000 [Acidobacteriota bacterium]|nr:hypothetical protein [Acidobacteriota bacterium]